MDEIDDVTRERMKDVRHKLYFAYRPVDYKEFKEVRIRKIGWRNRLTKTKSDAESQCAHINVCLYLETKTALHMTLLLFLLPNFLILFFHTKSIKKVNRIMIQ